MRGLLCIILVLAARLATAQYDPRALETLEAMSEKYQAFPSFSAKLTSSMTNEIEDIREDFSWDITVMGDNFRLDMEDQQIFSNGTTVWTYMPSVQEVNVDNVDHDTNEMLPSRFFDMYKNGFKYMYVGDQTESGVLCEEIDLVPEKNDARYFKVKLLIAKKDKTVKSWTMFDRSGNKYKYAITDFNPNVSVKESSFSFNPKDYPGVEVIDLR